MKKFHFSKPMKRNVYKIQTIKHILNKHNENNNLHIITATLIITTTLSCGPILYYVKQR